LLELNERYVDVSVKVMIVKSAKNDPATDANLWQGASANKLLDTFNTDRFTIMKSKFIKLRAANMGNTPSGAQTVGGGFQVGTPTTHFIAHAHTIEQRNHACAKSMYVYICIYIYTYIYKYVYMYKCVHACICIHICIYICIHMYEYMHIYTCIYLYIIRVIHLHTRVSCV